MNDRLAQAAGSPSDTVGDELAAIRVDRAQTELKHGRIIALLACDVGAPVLLVAAVETLIAARLQSFAGWGGAARLLLTAQRLKALGWSHASGARSMNLNVPMTVDSLQQMAMVRPGAVDRSLLTDAKPASAAMEAAIALAKRARLIPALVVAELPASCVPMLDAAQVLQLSDREIMQVKQDRALTLRRVSDAHVPIAAHEDCTLVLFRELNGDAEHVAIIVGQPDLAQPVPVRLHSACLTGDLLGSLRCDCGDQLRSAIDILAVDGGVLLYLAQEGRGTGLANKLRAYRLQDSGLDTIDADRHLGFRDDERDFQAAVAMLQALNIGRIRLLTNNPRKIEVVRRGGIEVVDRVPLVAPENRHNERYLRTKRERAGHLSKDDEQD